LFHFLNVSGVECFLQTNFTGISSKQGFGYLPSLPHQHLSITFKPLLTELESKERNHLTVCPNISEIASIEKRMGFWAWFNTPIRIALFFGLVLFASAIFNSTELWNFVEKIFKLF